MQIIEKKESRKDRVKNKLRSQYVKIIIWINV